MIKLSSLSALTLFAVVGGVSSQTLVAAEFLANHENVLGTSLELRIETETVREAEKVEEFAISQIDRLAKVLSRYDSQSELMRWQNGELSGPLSDDLTAVLKRAEFWRNRTGGAFDVRVGGLSKIWKKAGKAQQLPDEIAISEVTVKLEQAPWNVVSDGSFQRNDGLPISLDALAKGYILDEVCETVKSHFPQVKQLTVNIGGDLRKVGTGTLKVSVTDPSNAAEGAAPLASTEIAGSVGLATSGGYRRFQTIQGREYSHIIDPRSGQPVTRVVSATVIAPNAMDADAAATGISVLGEKEGLKLIESLDGFECLLATDRNTLVTSTGWPAHASSTTFSLVSLEEEKEESTSSAESDAESAKAGLFVDFTLNRSSKGRYRRPYVAIWLEDADGFPVKTALLWIQTEQPGPRWHRDLTRWYRNNRLRKVVEDKDLIGTISGATRGPGDYSAQFDGTDNLGKPLPHGKYTLCIEAAREHGTYQIIRKSVELGKSPITKQVLKGNVEVSKAAFNYVPWSGK